MIIKTFVIGPIQTNCYVVYDDNSKDAVVIDPAVYSEDIVEFIKKESLNVKYIINTHGHYDHIGGNNDFGYPVIIHEDDQACLNDPMRNLSSFMQTSLHPSKPFKVVKDKDIIKVGDFLKFKVIHTPGHTPGGISLECEGVLFTGDTLFSDGIGRTDLPFSDHNAMLCSLKKLMRYPDDTRFYPGHGPSSTIGDERRNES